MGLKSSTLLQEEDIEELQNETGCKSNIYCGVCSLATLIWLSNGLKYNK